MEQTQGGGEDVNGIVCGPEISGVPGKVQAAQQYLHFAQGLKCPPPMFDGARPESVDLNQAEHECYDAALKVLTQYFRGEVQFTDSVSKLDPPSPDE